MDGLLVRLARWRVPLGFLTAVVTLALATPTMTSLRVGFVVALAGEAVRLWAAGHLEKSREVTTSGPYRLMRHPLYVGSSILALGVVIAASSVAAGLLAGIYMTSTIGAAVTTEEAYLRRTFGEAYDRYRNSTAEPTDRRFSVERAMRNREYRAVIGLVVGFLLLAVRARVHL